ncbi:MAG: oxalate/formate MFS antiporter [Candidatus Eremiobacteraeota bacterium]|nr:oxalate/formate MFS antiporter [Candidatus Eremiobacteraeota bacterium]
MENQTAYRGLRNPWIQLVAGVICMAMIANYQYGWTVFVDPIGAAHGWGRAAIQVSFTVFVLVETWLVPFEAALVDRYGPRIMVLIGGVLAGLAWVIDSQAHSLGMLYAGGVVAGVGAGIVYGTCIGNALKWFAGRRGLAAGLTSAGFGAGAAITVIPLTNMIKSSGYEHTFLFFGILQGTIVVLASLFLVTPPKTKPADHKPARVLQGTHDYTPSEVLRSPVFYVMYLMFVMVGAGGLMAVAQLAPIAKDYYIDTIPVTIFAITAPALQYALSLNNIMNGITRPLLGFLSDRIGREQTMFGAFLLEGIGIFALMKYGTTPVAFVLLSGLVFFAWGEIYSIFPATTRDHFGQKYATTNYGMLYTAKGTAALIVPLASVITAATGSWTAALALAAVLNIVAAVMALGVLRPLRLWEIKQYRASAPVAAAAGVALAAVLAFGLAPPAVAADKTELVALIASNAQKSFDTIIADFQKKHPNVTVTPQYLGGSTIASMVDEGKPADVIMAGSGPVERVKNLVETPIPILQNKEIILVSKGNPLKIAGLHDLANPGVKLSLGTPGSAVGALSSQVIQKAAAEWGVDFVEKIRKNIVVQKEKGSDVLDAVGKEANATITFASDVDPSRFFAVPIEDKYNVVSTYVIAVPKATKNAAAAKLFVEEVTGSFGMATLKKNRYMPPPK